MISQPEHRHVPRTACLQTRVQLSCPRSKLLCIALNLPTVPLWQDSMQSTAVPELSTQNHQTCYPGEFPMVKGQFQRYTLLCKSNGIHWHNCDVRFCMEGEEKTAFTVQTQPGSVFYVFILIYYLTPIFQSSVYLL